MFVLLLSMEKGQGSRVSTVYGLVTRKGFGIKILSTCLCSEKTSYILDFIGAFCHHSKSF